MNDVQLKKYFDRIAEDFDNIYDDRGNTLDKLINRLFRKGMYERVTLTLQECANVENKSVLDIGCGSGRISLSLAESGAQVTGIDYSSKMIQLANSYLRKSKVNTKVKFVCCDFLKDFGSDKLFDITLALGVFDYVRHPIPFLEKMKDVTKEFMLASYPAKFALQTPIRKVWLYTRRCPAYFYTEKKLITMYESIGINNYKIMRMPTNGRIPTNYLVKAVVCKGEIKSDE